jgi:hypothetical protein
MPELIDTLLAFDAVAKKRPLAVDDRPPSPD